MAEHKGLRSSAAGQSGDTEGLSSAASAGSESVNALAEEGQSFEAEVTTHEVPEDDVPSEYGGES
jgi:hypothetical protein